MPIQPVPIPPAPPAPQRSDPATFEERNDAAVEYQFNTLPGAIDQQSDATYQNALEGAQSAIAAAASRAAAEAAADAASRAAGATEWVSGQTYAAGAAVWSPLDMQTYRRRTAGSGTLDPSLDPANWTQIGGTSLDDLHANALSF